MVISNSNLSARNVPKFGFKYLSIAVGELIKRNNVRFLPVTATCNIIVVNGLTLNFSNIHTFTIETIRCLHAQRPSPSGDYRFVSPYSSL